MTQWFARTQKPTSWSRGKGIEPPIANLYILFSSRLLPAAVRSFVTGQPWIRSWDYKLLINGSTEKVLSAKGGGGYRSALWLLSLTGVLEAQKAVWGENERLCCLPIRSSVQRVMKDQSLWPAGGLAQPLAEPHTQTNELRGSSLL